MQVNYEADTPRNNADFLPFSPGQAVAFEYPMSAPALHASKSFWDPESSLNAMDIDFAAADWASSQQLSGSFNWEKPQSFPEAAALVLSNPPSSSHGLGQHRELAPRSAATQEAVSTSMSFDFLPASSDDPFALVGPGAVNPELLFGLDQLPANTAMFPEPQQSLPQMKRPPTTQVTIEGPSSIVPKEPYQHQLRELRRDQEELRRSRTLSETSALLKTSKASFSSPARRPTLQRSFSDSRARRNPHSRRERSSLESERSGSRDDRNLPSHGRSSPVKQFGRPGLSSIPETFIAPKTRAAVTFSIDHNGRARTETTLIVERPDTSPTGSRRTETDASSLSGYSSDEEPIILPPNPKATFALPDKFLPDKGPKLAHFPASRRSQHRRDSGSSRSQASDHLPVLEDDSEPEVVVDQGSEGMGDAAIALRRVLAGRSDRRKRTSTSSVTPRALRVTTVGQPRNASPTTVTDPELATPSTDGEGIGSPSTRCVCHNPDGEGFMIQCESCSKWQHGRCVGINRSRLPPVWICAFCAQTPNMRGGRMRDSGRSNSPIKSSPLAHKGFPTWR